MASSAGIVKAVWLAVIAVAVVVAPLADAATSCGKLRSSLEPCYPYVQGSIKVVPNACCGAFKSIYGSAQTKPDRQFVCSCLKTAAANFKGISYEKAVGLPAKCGVKVPYKISPSTDCSKIQ